MTNPQKTMKAFAIVLAVLLTIVIIGSISAAAYSIYHIFSNEAQSNSLENDLNLMEDLMNYNESFTDVTSLNIVNGMGELTFLVDKSTDDIFTVTATNVTDEFYCNFQNGTLTIRDERHQVKNWMNYIDFSQSRPMITVTIPKNFKASDVKVTNGIGIINVNDINTDTLSLEVGAGKNSYNRIQANKVNIKGGVGTQDYYECIFQDVTMECGLGATSFSGMLLGNNKISAGVGTVTLNLSGGADIYSIKAETGIGRITVNGTKYSTFARNKKMDGENHITIEGGIGSVDVYIK